MSVVVQFVILAFRKLRQEDLKFKASLGYIVRPVSKKLVFEASYL
jgi:hypothetical protein